MTRVRTNPEGCGIAHASDLLGQRWTLLVVRELLLGPKRFTDLRAGISDISPNVLGQRLRELEETGLVRRRKLAPPAAAQVYELTEWGQELEPLVIGLGAWGSRAPFPGGEADLGPDAFVIALKTLFRPAGFAGVVDLRLGEDRFALEVRGGRFEARRGAADDPDLTILADAGPLAAALWHGGPLGDIELLGDVALFDRFRAAFPAPAPV